MMATFLSYLGLKCEIWEKRADPRLTSERGRSINLTLSARAFYTLSFLRPDDVSMLQSLRSAVPTPGRFIHRPGKADAYQPYSENKGEFLHSVNRQYLNNDLLDIAEKNNVKLNFGVSVTKVDVQNKTVIFTNGKGVEQTVPYNTLWGTDGSNSTLRAELERILEQPGNTQRSGLGYKEFFLPSDSGNFKLKGAHLHVWPTGKNTFFIGLPNTDGSFTCTLFSPSEGPQCIGNFSDDEIVELFKTQFPDAYALMGADSIIANHKKNPFSSLYSVETPTWNYKGDLVLLGDAAFGVVPFLGLGINCCLEACRHMFELVKMHKIGFKQYDWENIFTEFNNFKAHSDVLREASMQNCVELHKKLDDSHFLFRKDLERDLQKRFPDRFVESHSLFSFTNVPLRECGKQIKVQEMIAAQLAANKTTLEEVDYKHAEELINTHCAHLFQERMWYEKTPPPNNYAEGVQQIREAIEKPLAVDLVPNCIAV